jgi:class 3 adenylate cyclase
MTSARAAVPPAPAAPAHPGRQRVAGADRRDFTVIGPAVNLTARLKRLCSELGLDLLPSDGFAGLCAAKHHLVLEYRLPGIGSRVEAVTAFERA